MAVWMYCEVLAGLMEHMPQQLNSSTVETHGRNIKTHTRALPGPGVIAVYAPMVVFVFASGSTLLMKRCANMFLGGVHAS